MLIPVSNVMDGIMWLTLLVHTSLLVLSAGYIHAYLVNERMDELTIL